MIERLFEAIEIDEIIYFGKSGAYLEYDYENNEYFLSFAPILDDIDFDDENKVSAILLSIAVYLNSSPNNGKPKIASGIADDRLNDLFNNLLDENIYFSNEVGTDTWKFDIDFNKLLSNSNIIALLNFNASNLVLVDNENLN